MGKRIYVADHDSFTILIPAGAQLSSISYTFPNKCLAIPSGYLSSIRTNSNRRVVLDSDRINLHGPYQSGFPLLRFAPIGCGPPQDQVHKRFPTGERGLLLRLSVFVAPVPGPPPLPPRGTRQDGMCGGAEVVSAFGSMWDGVPINRCVPGIIRRPR
jgi:hypothetical protein